MFTINELKYLQSSYRLSIIIIMSKTIFLSGLKFLFPGNKVLWTYAIYYSLEKELGVYISFRLREASSLTATRSLPISTGY